MYYYTWKLKWDISNVYTDLINCDVWILWWIWRKYPDSYSLLKRKWYNEVHSVDDYECTDIINIDWWTYYMFIKTDKSKIKIYKEDWDDLTELYSWDFKDWLYERFTRFNFVKWDPRKLFKDKDDTTSDKWVENKCIKWDYYTDTSWNDYDTDSIIPSDYLYVYDYSSTPDENSWTIWQSFVINWVTSTEITIEWSFILWDKVNWDNLTYCVLPLWWEIFWFTTSDWFVNWHSDSFFTKAWLTPKNTWAVEYHKWVLNFLTTTWILFVWRRWNFSMFTDILSQMYVWDYMNLTSFNNYLVLFWKDKIGVITLEDDKNTWYVIPTLHSATHSYWIYDKYSFVNSEWWVYIVTNYKRVAAINISADWFDKFTITRKFQTFFDGKLDDVDIINTNIKNTDQRLYLFVYTSAWTTIYIYDQYYKIWLEHIVDSIKILNYSFYSKQFYWDKVYTYSWTQDWWTDYKQKIRAKHWDEKIETIKSFHLLKFAFWPYTEDDTNLKVYTTYDGQTSHRTYDNIKMAWYVRWWSWSTWPLWQWTLWSWIDTINNKWYVWVIEYDVWLFWEVLNFELEWTKWFELQSFIIWYEELKPHITEIDNVYLINNL